MTETDPRGGKAWPVRGSMMCVNRRPRTLNCFSEPELVDNDALRRVTSTSPTSRRSGSAMDTRHSPRTAICPPKLMTTLGASIVASIRSIA